MHGSFTLLLSLQMGPSGLSLAGCITESDKEVINAVLMPFPNSAG